MIAILFLAVVSFYLYRLMGGAPRLHVRRPQPMQAATTKINELAEYAGHMLASNKYTGAEKIYLQILKIDHRHTATYSRLGKVYMAMKNSSDAIECFQVATQLSPDEPTFYNLGVAYYENRNPMKAIAAFEKATMFGSSARTYVGLAKSYNRMGDGEHMVSSLEQAAELDPTARVLWLLHDAYEAAGRSDELPAVIRRIRKADPKDLRLRAMPKRPKARATAAAKPSRT
ncbi:MAG TPA: tetratricopeptide repeat protein [Candidatus Saccharimonadales bacterium]|nr:tetratricopeptide repeat protein [Candidatus Saccharimonadales bacterium]